MLALASSRLRRALPLAGGFALAAMAYEAHSDARAPVAPPASSMAASWSADALPKKKTSDPASIKPPLALQDEFDVVVVGGGIIGLATAREILRRYPGMTVAVLEKEREVAAHQTGHNSGVIHAGMYYVPGSVMAKTCVRGAALIYAYAEEHKIPHARCGKLIVASNEAEHAQVTKLFTQGTANGVPGLRVLNSAEVRAMEPNVSAYSALWSPATGVIDYAVVARHMAEEILQSGRADIKLSFGASDFAVGRDPATGVKLVTVTGSEPGQPGPTKRVRARHVITCAGFYADRVAQAAGGATDPKVVTFRGTYYQMKQGLKDIVRTNVYPVPSGGGIPVGVHFTPTVNERRGHQMIIGPGACLTFAREGYRFWDVSLYDLWGSLTNVGLLKFAVQNPSLSLGEVYKDLNKRAFLREAQKLVPSLTEDQVEESFSGVMSQVFDPEGQAAKDYIFERKVLDGTTMHVRNAPSPACTASLAIAETVVDNAAEDWGWGPAAKKK